MKAKYVSFVIFLAGFICGSGRVTAQCMPDDGRLLTWFYVDTLSRHTWTEFCIDDAHAACDCYLPSQDSFFLPRHLISFSEAMKTACDKKNLVVTIAILNVSDDSLNTVWVLKGPESVKFGGRLPGNATITEDVLTLNARTGEVISFRKEKYRAIVDF